MDIFQLFHRRFHSYLILIWINILEYKTMAVGNLFKYKTTYELTLSDSGKRMTGPMYNNTIKIHKGMIDIITFNVSDDSRRAANVANLTLTFRMIDANTGVTVLSKTPVARDDVNGKIDVEFLWAETVNLDIGLYQFSVTATDVNDSESIFYTCRWIWWIW